MDIREMIEDCPIIAAVKDEKQLEECLKSDCKIVFVLFGTICNIGELVEQIKNADRAAFVHLDLISGLSAKEISVDFIKNTTKADGVISTRPAQIKRAKELSLLTVQRFFVIDSLSLQNIKKMRDLCHPDFVEILPGIMPKIIRKIAGEINTPIIAGGLINEKEDIILALKNGAVAISTTNREVWFM